MITRKSNFVLMLLAALLVTSLAQAQIKLVENAKHGKYTFKAYTPSSLPTDKSQLIAELNKQIRYLKGMSGDNIGAYEGLKALNDGFYTNTGTLFYFEDFIIGDTISLYNTKFPYEVGIPVSKVRGNKDKKVCFHFDTFEHAQQFAEGMFYLQPYNNSVDTVELSSKLSEFQKTANTYKEMSDKPAITEEQRKYIVQANAMNEKKDYKKAVGLYNKAIEISPVAYPAAYYNLALLYSHEKDFRVAIFNMKKYLLLVPGAPDARAAQDKIYEWEIELEN